MIVDAGRAASKTLRAAAIAALVALLALPVACDHARRRALAEERVASAQGEAARQSGRAAVETVARHGAETQRGERLGRDNRRRIEHADGADEVVDAGVHGAGLDGLCRRAAYRERERCRLRGSGPR